MIFADVNIKIFENFELYSTLLLDVLEIRPLLKGEFYKQWFGLTSGLKAADLGLDNLNLFFEYTRLNPWIYDNKYSTTTYEHLDFVLGHWIGNNADLLSLKLDYSFIRELNFSLKMELMRKGGEEDNYYAYEGRTELPFLFGERRNDVRVELEAKYNPLHNLYLKGKYIYSEIEDDFPERTLPFLLGAKNSFSLSVSYGLP
jgi:hypothetical protein